MLFRSTGAPFESERSNGAPVNVGGACHTYLMTTTIDGVFVDLTGDLFRSGISAASFAELCDDQSEHTHRAFARQLP